MILLEKPPVLIIGYGLIGSHVHKEFEWADIQDPAQGHLQDDNKKWTYAFVSVPTEMKEDGSADVSIVRSVIKQFADQVDTFIVKSTVPPGTIDSMIADPEFPSSIVFSPEYYGRGPHSQEIPPMNFVILGGDRQYTNHAAELFMLRHSAYYRITQTSARAAELTKYMVNSWLANQVTFVNEFYRVAKAFDVGYVELRELFIHDSRVSPAHTYVYPQSPYWDSHCFNKDLPAIIQASIEAGYVPEYIQSIITANNKFKGLKD